ncbi:MAG: leucyl aminopeptidase [Candidatus Tectomicrobia bacterium]|nr:leucyl aminopeptidase [Candidatus Tectomicrobia bacterium]
MKIRLSQEAPQEIAADLLVVPRFEADAEVPPPARALDRAAKGLLSRLYATGDVSGKLHECCVVYTQGSVPCQRIMSLGCGKKEAFKLDTARAVIGKMGRALHPRKISRLAILPPGLGLPDLSPQHLAAACVEGLRLGLYRFTEFKTKEEENGRTVPEECVLLLPAAEKLAPIQAAVEESEIVCEAVLLARDLITRPGCSSTPTALAEVALEVGRLAKMSCTVLDRADMEKLGMGALLGVARGSQEPPKFIILEYRGARRKGEKPVVLVGKGITFDSGGLSLKPAASMEQMKYDMAGGAAVLATMQVVGRLKLPLNVVGLVPATENLPSGTAYKPGDVLRSLSGQTIEVLNTDAEGRLILADALAYACRYKPAAILDIATLTGACIVALGDNLIGMLGSDEALQEEVRRAADFSGERVWPLPLWEEFSEQLKSDIADWKNVGSRAAGTITAGMFLSKFVQSYPWVHLDIAGPAWAEKEKPYVPKGASGVGVRLFVEFLKRRASSQAAAGATKTQTKKPT